VIRYLLRLEYDGTDFSGWQAQRGRRTVQGELEAILERLCGRRVPVTGSGRTDAGVHAECQAAHIDLEDREGTRVIDGLASLAPRDVAVLSYTEVDACLHARFSARSRFYRYRLIRGRHPLLERQAAISPYERLDTSAMDEAAGLCTGTGDWRGMSREGSGNRTWLVDVLEASVSEDCRGWTFGIRADRFLRGMVRIWAGTLVDVGRGRHSPEVMRQILSTGDRRLAGPSLPARGLTLAGVCYD
jgi:tRNA pseudouridine38-40 synthase